MAAFARLTVIGVGSSCGRDDAVGLELTRAVAARGTHAGVRVALWEDADALTLAHDLIGLLAQSGPILVVDCADMGLGGGQARCFEAAAVRLGVRSGSVSTHGLGMADALALARGLGFERPVHVFGVQPFDLSPVPGLTPEMAARLPALVQALEADIAALVA